MTVKQQHALHSAAEPLLLQDESERESQINVPPSGSSKLWKVVITAVRCPVCGSTDHKAETGKRFNGDGMLEQYRHCRTCESRFRTVIE